MTRKQPDKVTKHQAWQLVRDYPFAQLHFLTSPSSLDNIIHLPIYLDATSDTLYCHLANANNPLDHWPEGTPVSVVFSGPHAYISPTWAKEQKVPTWNYAWVHIQTRAEYLSDTVRKHELMEKMVRQFEPEWRQESLPPKTLQAMLKAITFIKLPILNWQARFKLSQNKTAKTRQTLEKALKNKGYQTLSSLMGAN